MHAESAVVDGVDFSVTEGEIFGVLGLNGAGKTTMVECVQGLRRPDSGSVRLLGRDPQRERSALASRVGSQLQDSNLPERMRVREAIGLFADRPVARDDLAEWGLDALLGTAFGALSARELMDKLQAADIAFAPVNGPDELAQHPHLRRISVPIPGGAASYPAPAPLRAGETRRYGAVPALGEHSEKVRKEFS